MTLYLTAAPNRLAQARAATAQLAHAAYRIGPGSHLLAAPPGGAAGRPDGGI